MKSVKRKLFRYFWCYIMIWLLLFLPGSNLIYKNPKEFDVKTYLAYNTNKSNKKTNNKYKYRYGGL